MTAQLSTPKPTLRILLYTDAHEFDEDFLGLSKMKERLKAHEPAFAVLEPILVCRNDKQNADNKLDDILREAQGNGEPFDEIWFFGLQQANTQTPLFGSSHDGPFNELTDNEIAALRQWMGTENGGHGGGVLMTGDHSGTAPGRLRDTNLSNRFLGLGRAIGHAVPRAGALRTWEGSPTAQAGDTFSTITSFGNQGDRFPQHLNLLNVNGDGDPDENGQPHPLFFYSQDEYIRVFPDHHHEGAVSIPQTFDQQEWPDGPFGQQVRPHVVAQSVDIRRGQQLNIIATYNGDLANVGRIVADSTWHHYTNVNLDGFEHPAPIGSESDQIGQFYGNLAMWLAPRSKREEMARAMNWQLARYTLLLERTGNAEQIGNVAHSLINRTASPCEVNELLRVLPPPQAPAFEAAALTGNVAASVELFLGNLLKGYHNEILLTQAEPNNGGALELAPTLNGTSVAVPATVDDLINAAYQETLAQEQTRLSDRLAKLTSLHNNNT